MGGGGGGGCARGRVGKWLLQKRNKFQILDLF